MAGPWEKYAAPDAAEAPAGPWQKYAEPAAPEPKPFLEKLGNFARKVYENPPPTVAGIRDVIKGAPAAATELTWGADPQAAEQAAGTIAGAASLGLPTAPGLRAGEGVFARPTSPEARAAPIIPPRPVLPPSAAEQAVEAAGRLGVDVPRYLASEGTAVPQIAAGIKNVPIAGEPIVRSAQALNEQMAGAREALAPLARSPDLAGESARSGIEGWITGGSKRPVTQAYEAVDKLIDPSVRAPLTATAETVADIMASRAQSRIPGASKAVERVLPAVQDPAGMDYQGAKGLRSFLGETTPQELVAQGINPVEAKRLYGALTKDLGQIITQAGGEGAHAAWREANTLARLTSLQRDALTKIVGNKGDLAPEAVFNKLLNYAGSKSSADLNRLRLAKRTMGPAAWDEVGSAFIARMGAPPEGGFSADRFVTAFANLSPQARHELFTPQQHAALNDLMTVSQHVRDRISRFSNPSGTSRGVFGGGMLTGMLADPVTIIGGLLGTRLTAEALSRPAVVRAANQVARRAATTGNPEVTRRALERLQEVALREGLFNALDTRQQNPRRELQRQR